MKMINKFSWLICIVTMLGLSSCSWEELPAYEDANIDNVYFYYRWKSPTDKDPVTGEPMVRNQQLATPSVSIDQASGTVTVTVRANPDNFDANILQEISLNNIVGAVGISTAAKIAPADNHKVLGVPDDWTTPHSFVVTAANGNKKNWTITVTELVKE